MIQSLNPNKMSTLPLTQIQNTYVAVSICNIIQNQLSIHEHSMAIQKITLPIWYTLIQLPYSPHLKTGSGSVFADQNGPTLHMT